MVDVEVTFEYVAEQEDELNIKVGDIIKNVTMSEGGWWEGELNGKVGMFPDNFVKVIEKPKPTKVKEDPAARKEVNKQRGASVRELASKIKDDVHVGIGAPKKKEVQPSAKRKKAKVVFSYEPENDDELKLEVGDVVDVLKQEEEGWWEGSLNGKVGMFPSNFVEEIEETDPEKIPEEKPNEAPVEGKKKLIGGIGLGNIFEGGPIKLKSTSVKNTDKVTHSPPDPVVRHIEEESKPSTVTKREKHGLHVRPPIPTPRPSQVGSLTPHPSTSHTSDSNLEDGHAHYLSSDDSSHTDLEERDGVKTQESWVNVLFGEQGSGTTNGYEQVKHVLDQESDDETNLRDPMTPGKRVSQQFPSYTILSGLDKLSVMQLMEQKDVTEENLIEYADVEVDEENKENVGRRCVSAIASLGSGGGSCTSVLGRVQHNVSNNNNVEDPKTQSKSVDSLEINIDMEKQNTDTSLKNLRIDSWLSVEHRPPTVSATSVGVASRKRKESLFKRVMKLDMFRKRSKSVMPYNGKEIEGKLTCNRQHVPSLTELCRITLKPYCSIPVRTPLKEITASHVNQKLDPDQSASFEVSVDSLDSADGSFEAVHAKKTNTINQMYSDDDESLLSLLMGREDVRNDNFCDKVKEDAHADMHNIKKGSALEDNLKRSEDELHDGIASDSYLGSLNRTGQLSPFMKMIASRYHLFDPETQKWKAGYMDGPEDLDLSASFSSRNLTAVNLTGEQASTSPVHEMDVASRTSHIEGNHHHSASTVPSSYNVLPPGSVREKVLHYEHMYVNDLVDQVIEQTMHGLCLEQCLEELGSLGHHPELRHRLMKECNLYTGANIPDCHRSEGEISPPGSELFTDGSEGEILTPKLSDGEISSENEDGCVQPSGICQKSHIEDSLYSGMTDGVDTDYATAMSDMDTDGSYVVSFLSNADLDVSIPELEVNEQPTLNASGEYVDLPEQLSHNNGCYGCHSHTAIMSCNKPVLPLQKNIDGPFVSPIHTQLGMDIRACPMKDMHPVSQDCPDTRPYTSIGTQTPEIVRLTTSDNATSMNRSMTGYRVDIARNTEDRASSPIKELLRYDTTLEDSLDTSDLGTPAKVRPRYSSSPIKTYVEEGNQRGKRKLEDTSNQQGKVHCPDSLLTRNLSLTQPDKSNRSNLMTPSSKNVETFDVHDCTEKRRKRFSWKKLFQSKAKEPVVLISYRRCSDKEENLIKGSPRDTGTEVCKESNRTMPPNSSNNALCENEVHQNQPLLVYRTRPFSEDLNTVEIFFSHEQDMHHKLDQYRNQDQNGHCHEQNQEPDRQDRNHQSASDESDGEQYSLSDMEIDEEEEQARIDRVRDTSGQCEQCDLSDLHIHGQSLLSQSAVHADITKEDEKCSPVRVDQKSVPNEYSDDDVDSEGVSLDSPNISPSLAIAIRNNVITTPDSPDVNLDSFLQEALRPIDDLLDESTEGINLEEEEVTPRFDNPVLTQCTSELPEKYPGFTYISPSMENILAVHEDDLPNKVQYVHIGQGDVFSSVYEDQAETDASNLSLEYVLSLERKFKEEQGSPELKNTPENTPQSMSQRTPQNMPCNDEVERYPSFTFVGEKDPEALYVEKVTPDFYEDMEAGMSNLSSSAEGLYDYEDSFESSDSDEEREGQNVMEKDTASVDESEEIEEVIEVDYSLDQSANDSSGLDIQSFQAGTKCEESYIMYGSGIQRVPSFISEYLHSTPSHHNNSMLGACALPTLEEQGSKQTKEDNLDTLDPELRGRSSYSFARPATETIEEGELSDSGLLLSFSSSPDNSCNTINV